MNVFLPRNQNHLEIDARRDGGGLAILCSTEDTAPGPKQMPNSARKKSKEARVGGT